MHHGAIDSIAKRSRALRAKPESDMRQTENQPANVHVASFVGTWTCRVVTKFTVNHDNVRPHRYVVVCGGHVRPPLQFILPVLYVWYMRVRFGVSAYLLKFDVLSSEDIKHVLAIEC